MKVGLPELVTVMGVIPKTAYEVPFL
jgi:hypothetical protein